MPVVRRIVVGFSGIALLLTLVACQAAATALPQAAVSQAPLAVSATPTTPMAGDVIWGKVPYCNCLATSATANVASALKTANLTVSLQELSPRDGWLYFAVTFDPDAVTLAQVRTAMITGGAELLDGPP